MSVLSVSVGPFFFCVENLIIAINEIMFEHRAHKEQTPWLEKDVMESPMNVLLHRQRIVSKNGKVYSKH